MTTKLNHAKYKREVVEILVQHFIDSGAEYTCTAVFFNVCRDLAYNYALQSISMGYEFSNGSYPITFATNVRDIFLSAASKQYHNEVYLPSQKDLI